MATPEIHVLTPRDGRSNKSRKKNEVASNDGKPSKRQRVVVRRGKKEQDGDMAKAQGPVVKRDLLSTNTQSFRHLFSFGTDQGGGAGSANAVGIVEPAGESGGRTEQIKPLDAEPEPAVRFSIFDEEEVVPETAVEDPSALGGLGATNQEGLEVVSIPSAKAEKEEVFVHDGLAHDSPADVRVMALEFNGSGCSVAELQTEWLDGGKKDELREDLRMKRYKRMRGRAPGMPSSKRWVAAEQS